MTLDTKRTQLAGKKEPDALHPEDLALFLWGGFDYFGRVHLPPDSSELRPEDQWLLSVEGPAQVLYIGDPGSVVFRALERVGPSLELTPVLFDPSRQELRLKSFPRETFASVYWELRDEAFEIEHAQRVLANLFQALKPRSGKLALSRPRNLWPDVAFESLLRQTGFKLLSQWTSPDHQLWISERV